MSHILVPTPLQFDDVLPIQDYGGISASRLEVLEERLKDDVLAELKTYGGRILLHAETADGNVIPVWEEARESDVSTLKEVFTSKKSINGVTLHYSRVPITSERPPDFHESVLASYSFVV